MHERPTDGGGGGVTPQPTQMEIIHYTCTTHRVCVSKRASSSRLIGVFSISQAGRLTFGARGRRSELASLYLSLSIGPPPDGIMRTNGAAHSRHALSPPCAFF